MKTKSFDNTKPNIILITDNTNVLTMTKVFGVHKIAYILKNAGYEVAVIDHVSVFSMNEIIQLLTNLVSEQTLFVGINNFYYFSVENLVINSAGGVGLNEAEIGSFLPHGKQYNKKIKDLVLSINPNCKFVIGGPNVRDSAEFNDFDYMVSGFAEMSVVNLAEHLYKGTVLKKSCNGNNNPIIVNDPKAEGYDFQNSTMRYFPYSAVLNDEVLFLETGRGCIFKCSFCSFPLIGKKKLDYMRHKQSILDELLYNYKNFNVTRYMMVDDTFNDTVEKCQMIYEISQQLPFKLEYWAYIRLDLLAAKPETIEMLINSGCRAMFFGIETLNPKTAAAIRKGGNKQKQISTIRYIKEKWGKQVNLHGSFIFGLPHEDVESIKKTMSFLTSNENYLDSWTTHSLKIRYLSNETTMYNGFFSDIDINFKKYGYKNVGLYNNHTHNSAEEYTTKKNQFSMIWENEHMSFGEADDLSRLASNQGRKKNNKPSITEIFNIAGLGISLDNLLDVPHKDMDWHAIDCKKLSRAIEYKKTLFNQLDIANKEDYFFTWDHELKKFKSFGNYLVARKNSISS